MKLSKDERAKMSASKFEGPHRSLPVNDHDHARAALLLVGKSERAGTISPHEAAVIKEAARRELKR